MISKSNAKREAMNLAVITVGIILYAIGFTIFILPHRIVIGGMTGLGTLVYYATNGFVPVAVTMYAANIILFLIGLKSLGKGFLIRTLYGFTVVSILVGAMEVYFTSHPALVTSAPMSVAIGAMLCGLGIGLYYSHHGTTGGTDIIAALVAQRSSMSIGRVIMIVDLSIVALSFFLPFDGDMEARIQSRTQTIIMGWLAIFLYSYIADKYIYAGNQTMQLLIISDKWETIATRITHEVGRGVTTLDGHGYWTGQPRKMLLVWCRNYNIEHIYKVINETDPKAYVVNSRVHNIFGHGFNHLPAKRSSKFQ